MVRIYSDDYPNVFGDGGVQVFTVLGSGPTGAGGPDIVSTGSMDLHVNTLAPVRRIVISAVAGIGTFIPLANSFVSLKLTSGEYYSGPSNAQNNFIIWSGVDSAQQCLFTGIQRLEVVPNATLSKNIKTSVPTSTSFEDFDVLKFMIANKAHFGLRTAYKNSEYAELISSGYFNKITERKQIVARAGGLWDFIKDTVKPIVPGLVSSGMGALGVGQFASPVVAGLKSIGLASVDLKRAPRGEAATKSKVRLKLRDEAKYLCSCGRVLDIPEEPMWPPALKESLCHHPPLETKSESKEEKKEVKDKKPEPKLGKAAGTKDTSYLAKLKEKLPHMFQNPVAVQDIEDTPTTIGDLCPFCENYLQSYLSTLPKLAEVVVEVATPDKKERSHKVGMAATPSAELKGLEIAPSEEFTFSRRTAPVVRSKETVEYKIPNYMAMLDLTYQKKISESLCEKLGNDNPRSPIYGVPFPITVEGKGVLTAIYVTMLPFEKDPYYGDTLSYMPISIKNIHNKEVTIMLQASKFDKVAVDTIKAAATLTPNSSEAIYISCFADVDVVGGSSLGVAATLAVANLPWPGPVSGSIALVSPMYGVLFGPITSLPAKVQASTDAGYKLYACATPADAELAKAITVLDVAVGVKDPSTSAYVVSSITDVMFYCTVSRTARVITPSAGIVESKTITITPSVVRDYTLEEAVAILDEAKAKFPSNEQVTNAAAKLAKIESVDTLGTGQRKVFNNMVQALENLISSRSTRAATAELRAKQHAELLATHVPREKTKSTGFNLPEALKGLDYGTLRSLIRKYYEPSEYVDDINMAGAYERLLNSESRETAKSASRNNSLPALYARQRNIAMQILNRISTMVKYKAKLYADVKELSTGESKRESKEPTTTTTTVTIKSGSPPPLPKLPPPPIPPGSSSSSSSSSTSSKSTAEMFEDI